MPPWMSSSRLGGILSAFTYTEQQLSVQDRKIIRFHVIIFHRYRRICEERGNLIYNYLRTLWCTGVYNTAGYGVCEYCGFISKRAGRCGKPDERTGKPAILWKWSRYVWGGIQTAFCSSAFGLQKAGSLKQEMFRPLPHPMRPKREILRYVKGSSCALAVFQEYTEPAPTAFLRLNYRSKAGTVHTGDETKLVNTANRIVSVSRPCLLGLELYHANTQNLKGLALEARVAGWINFENIEHFCYQGRNSIRWWRCCRIPVCSRNWRWVIMGELLRTGRSCSSESIRWIDRKWKDKAWKR